MTSEEEREKYQRLAAAHATWQDAPEAQRAAWLAALGDEDPALARDLEQLLAASRSAESLFADEGIDRRRGLPHPGLVQNEATVEELPEAIGPYRVLEHLGSGGMGVVYAARQVHPRRRVAIKLLRADLARGTRLRRFHHEAEAQGRLRHPGIAQVYGTGVCDLGRGEQPYLVLELVEGSSLLGYVQEEQLDRRTRLELVARLCDAVQHAHEHGVVHRDLKPDNVRVDREGQTKVLDFGIARIRAEEASPLTTIHTAEGDIVGTITHVAPEQLQGDPDAVGPAADIYALGVLAFELLTGRLPHEVAGLRFTEAVRQVTEQAAPRLGTLDRSLRGDLDTIVGKALELEPSRRYVSAAAFGADLRRFLGHRPIAARRPSLAYRASRFVRRHRGLSFGLALSLATLLVGLTAVLRYAQREGAARRLSEQRAIQAQLASNSATAQALDRGEAWAARKLLDQLPPDLRGWEWDWLHARTPYIVPGLDPQYLAWNGPYLAAMEDARPLRDPERFFARRAAIASLLDPGAAPRPVEGFTASVKLMPEFLYVDGERQPRGAAAVIGSMPKPGAGDALEDGIGLLDIPNARYLDRIRIDAPTSPHREVAKARIGGFFNGRLVLGRDSRDPGGHPHWTSVELGDLIPGQPWSPLCFPADYLDANECIVDPTLTYVLVETNRNRPGARVVLELDGWRELGRLPPPAPDEQSNKAAFCPDGSRLALLSVEDRIDIYRLPGLEHERSLSVPPAWCVYWVRQDQLLLGGSGFIHLLDAATGAILEVHPKISDAGAVHLHPEWPLFAYFGGRDEVLTVGRFGVPELPAYRELRGHTSWIYPCAVSPDGSLIASSAPTDPHVLLWDAWSGELLARLPRGLRELHPYVDRIAPLFFSEDNIRLITTEPSGGGLRVVRYDLVTGRTERSPLQRGPFDWPGCPPEQTQELLRDAGDIRGKSLGPRLAGHPDGSRLFTANTVINHDRSSLSTATLLIDPRSEERGTFPGNTLSIAVSPDRQRLAVGEEGKVRILELPSGRHLATALDEGSQVPDYYAVAWSPNGTRLAAADSTGRIRIVETRYFSLVLELPPHEDYVFSLAWSPDGTRLVSASGDKTLRIYDSVHSITRFAQNEERQRLVQKQQELLQTLTRELGDAQAAAHELLERAGQDLARQQAARRACLLAWADSAEAEESAD